MDYVWLGLYGFVLMFFITISVNALTARFLRRFPESKPVSFIAGLVLIASYLIIALFSPLIVSLSSNILFSFLVLCAVQGVILKTIGIQRELCLLGLSILSVLMIPSDMPIFQTIPSYICYPLMSISLYLIIRIFVIMDKVPSLSLITLFAQGILFFFIARSGFFNADISHAIFYMMLSSLTIAQLMKVVTGSCVLGKYAASVSGFIFGYIAIYIMAKGFVFVPLMLFSYDILEIVFAGLLTLISTHHLYPRTKAYLIERAIQTGFSPNKLNRYIFLMFIGISFSVFIAINEKTLVSATAVLLLFILISMYLRLKTWGTPRASFKDLKSDLKQGFIELKEQMTHIPLKTNLPKKKVPQKGSKK